MSSASSFPLLPASPSPSLPLQSALFSKLKWLMFFRLLLATSLFVSAVVLQLRDTGTAPVSSLLYAVIVTIYVFSAVYAAVMRQVPNLSVFAYIQFFFDTLFITPIIYLTGGIESIFSFLYFLVIISASYLLYTPGAFVAATLSGICYSLLIILQMSRALPLLTEPPLSEPSLSQSFYNIIINVFAFFLVAFLSSYLAEQLKRTRDALLEEQLNLRELEEFNRKIVENIRAGLLTLDRGARITFLNRAAQEILGRSMGDIFGTPADELLEGLLQQVNEARQRSDSLHLARWERRFTRQDGQQLYLGFSMSPLRGPAGEEMGQILIFEDLTRIKQLEEKARRDDRLQTIGRLAANLAHEIRNPLASLSGSIQVLQAELSLSEDNRTLMDIVLRETDRLNGLLTDFLSYVRQVPPSRRSVDPTEVVQDVLSSLKYDPRFRPGLEVSTRFNHQSRVLADPQQLRQVLWNLLLNAIDAMEGVGRLEVSTEDRALPGSSQEELVLCVTDSGPGIDPAIRERIFEPFFSTKSGGTGLGLALVEKIVQAHDGHIRVRPQEGLGTTFEITLPTVEGPDATEER